LALTRAILDVLQVGNNYNVIVKMTRRHECSVSISHEDRRQPVFTGSVCADPKCGTLVWICPRYLVTRSIVFTCIVFNTSVT